MTYLFTYSFEVVKTTSTRKIQAVLLMDQSDQT